MSLADIITALEAEDPDRVVPLGFTNPHSYRGDYYDLAFEPAANVTIGEMLAAARSAVGTTYTGWKGGEFRMDGDSWCWLSEQGTASCESLGPTLLRLLLASSSEVLPAWEAMYQPGNVSDYLVGYTNDEVTAKAAAEAWFRSQRLDEPGRLEWVEKRGGDRELIEDDGDGIPTNTGLVVRCRPAS